MPIVHNDPDRMRELEAVLEEFRQETLQETRRTRQMLLFWLSEHWNDDRYDAFRESLTNDLDVIERLVEDGTIELEQFASHIRSRLEEYLSFGTSGYASPAPQSFSTPTSEMDRENLRRLLFEGDVGNVIRWFRSHPWDPHSYGELLDALRRGAPQQFFALHALRELLFPTFVGPDDHPMPVGDGDAAVPLLRELLNSPDPVIRTMTADLLARMGIDPNADDGQNAAVLILLLERDPVPSVRAAAARALGAAFHFTEKILDALSATMFDPDWEVRRSSIDAIGRTYSEATHAALRTAVGHPDLVTRNHVRSTLITNRSLHRIETRLRELEAAVQHSPSALREFSSSTMEMRRSAHAAHQEYTAPANQDGSELPVFAEPARRHPLPAMRELSSSTSEMPGSAQPLHREFTAPPNQDGSEPAFAEAMSAASMLRETAFAESLEYEEADSRPYDHALRQLGNAGAGEAELRVARGEILSALSAERAAPPGRFVPAHVPASGKASSSPAADQDSRSAVSAYGEAVRSEASSSGQTGATTKDAAPQLLASLHASADSPSRYLQARHPVVRSAAACVAAVRMRDDRDQSLATAQVAVHTARSAQDLGLLATSLAIRADCERRSGRPSDARISYIEAQNVWNSMSVEDRRQWSSSPITLNIACGRTVLAITEAARYGFSEHLRDVIVEILMLTYRLLRAGCRLSQMLLGLLLQLLVEDLLAVLSGGFASIVARIARIRSL
jgi:hypothetical protein